MNKYVLLAPPANPDIKRELKSQLLTMSPRAFELFAGEFLVYAGLDRVSVTRYIGDGGIDAEGDLIAGRFRLDAIPKVVERSKPSKRTKKYCHSRCLVTLAHRVKPSRGGERNRRGGNLKCFVVGKLRRRISTQKHLLPNQPAKMVVCFPQLGPFSAMIPLLYESGYPASLPRQWTNNSSQS